MFVTPRPDVWAGAVWNGDNLEEVQANIQSNVQVVVSGENLIVDVTDALPGIGGGTAIPGQFIKSDGFIYDMQNLQEVASESVNYEVS